ncbi:hypothetical protein BH10CHL1_BH10CHL1_35560 [soil metagenome]
MAAQFIKPLMHWIIYRGYKVRFTQRTPDQVTGILTTGTGEIIFRYEPTANLVHLPDERIVINEYGWELNKEAIPLHREGAIDRADE